MLHIFAAIFSNLDNVKCVTSRSTIVEPHEGVFNDTHINQKCKIILHFRIDSKHQTAKLLFDFIETKISSVRLLN